MPAIQSLSRAGNALTIITASGRTRSFDLSTINTNLTAGQIENQLGAIPKLENELTNAGIYVHVFSKVPLDFIIRITDGTEADPPNGWWL